MAMVSANISNFGDMDDATANLILELQLSDINTMQSSSTGKGRKGELTDAELALSLLQQNLEEIHSIMSDRRMTQSIATAVETDGNIVAAATNEEHIAHGDNALAHSLNGRSRIPENKIPAEMLNDHVLVECSFQRNWVEILLISMIAKKFVRRPHQHRLRKILYEGV